MDLNCAIMPIFTTSPTMGYIAIAFLLHVHDTRGKYFTIQETFATSFLKIVTNSNDDDSSNII
jgi:hypothetical protein